MIESSDNCMNKVLQLEACSLKLFCTFALMELKHYLEKQMDLKKVCQIRFRDVQGAVTELRGHIVKMEEVSGREIIETDAGFVIGMDQLLEVDCIPAQNYC